MPPPFRLELPDKHIGSYRRERIAPTKNEYSEGVKFSNWEKFREYKPIDVDPYCAGKVSHFLSHYNRFGMEDSAGYQTTTGEMLNQIYLKKKQPKQAHMNNYYSFQESKNCSDEADQGYIQFCKEICADDFMTTMQHDYTPPYECTLKRVAFPVIPFMQYRRFKFDRPEASTSKFYDDDFHKTSAQMNKQKGSRFVSYNAGLGTYELGNKPIEQQEKRKN